MRDRSKSEMHVLRPGVEVEQCLLVQENPGGIDGPRGRVSRDNLRCGLDRDPGEQVAITCLQKVDDLTQVTGLRLEGTSQERTGLFQMTGRKGLGQVQDLAGVYPVRTRPQGFDDLRDEASGLLGWYR